MAQVNPRPMTQVLGHVYCCVLVIPGFALRELDESPAMDKGWTSDNDGAQLLVLDELDSV